MKILKWGTLSLLTLLVVGVGAVYATTERRFSRTYEVADYPLQLRTDSATLALGRRLATTRGCVDCHGENLAGTQFLDVPILARLFASNLTAGEGGVGRDYSPADWERAIRHGVRPDGRPLLFMPSHEFHPISDPDLTALVSYIATVPPVASEPPRNSVGPLGRFLVATGGIPTFVPAELIDHSAPRPASPTPGVTVEYGRYLATGCVGCHGERYSGGPIPGAPPDFLPGTNLTPHPTGLADWTEADFFRLMREGVRPDGSPVDPQMPWQGLRELTDDELRAIWLFLRGLPPIEVGNR